MIACPIRYSAIAETSWDSTWVFAVNYGAAHGLKMGRDLAWTTGPLGYLTAPQDIGGNLVLALGFQSLLWLALIGILADLFYAAALPLRNLAFFSVFFALSSPLYWCNYMGLENLLLAGVLVLLAMARVYGGRVRYVGALALAGVIPLIKLSGGLIAGGAILGFLIERSIRNRGRIYRETALAIAIPSAVLATGFGMFLPSMHAVVQYLRDGAEIVSGFSAAMSTEGDPFELLGVIQASIGIGAFLLIRTRSSRPAGWFLLALLLIPFIISVKHGFVRQDDHVLNFFCFVGVALAVSSLVLPLDRSRMGVAALVLLHFICLSLPQSFGRVGMGLAATQIAGVRGPWLAWHALSFNDLRARLRAEAAASPEPRLEPEIRALIGAAPVASLSLSYGGALREGLNLQLYPVLQRYAAYTKSLDARNGAWVGETGPRFLLFDGSSIDGRHPWAETPAMWLEIYRWYDTRLRGKRNLLLERRPAPRFQTLKSNGHATVPSSGGLEMPVSDRPIFWTMQCGASLPGDLQKVFFRIPSVTMEVSNPNGSRKSFRVLLAVLASPVLGNYMPGNLGELASLLDKYANPRPFVRRLDFSGRGLTSYKPFCDVEFLDIQN